MIYLATLCTISLILIFFFFFSSRRRHTRFKCDWSSDVCSSDLEALTTGNMKNQAADLTDIQKRDIAEWVSGRKLGAAESGDAKAMTNRCASNPPIKDLTSNPGWNGWSPDLVNHRLQSATAANISAASVARL